MGSGRGLPNEKESSHEEKAVSLCVGTSNHSWRCGTSVCECGGTSTQIAASLPGESGAALSAAAAEAFTDAFGLAILIGAGVILLGALVVARVMPARQEPLPEAKPEEVEEVEAPPVPLPEPAPEPATV